MPKEILTLYTLAKERTGTLSIKIGPIPKFYHILNEIFQPYVGFRTVLFSSLSLPVFLSLIVKLCVMRLAKNDVVFKTEKLGFRQGQFLAHSVPKMF